ncbi:hypothetical protein GQ473_00505 [archaeon]|nr:hypothetical protein [archaeon]
MMRKTDTLYGVSKNHKFYMNEYECGAWAVLFGCGITYLIFRFYGLF